MRVCLCVSCGGLTSTLSFVVSNYEFVTFPIGILGQVCYLIVSIPDLCTLTYFVLIRGVHYLKLCHYKVASRKKDL